MRVERSYTVFSLFFGMLFFFGKNKTIIQLPSRDFSPPQGLIHGKHRAPIQYITVIGCLSVFKYDRLDFVNGWANRFTIYPLKHSLLKMKSFEALGKATNSKIKKELIWTII